MKLSLLSVGLITITTFSLQACSGTKNNNPEPPKASLDKRFDSYYGSGSDGRYNKTINQAHHTLTSLTTSSKRSPFKRNAPTRYVVKKGDSLWRISQKFLRDPGYWPEIWDKNQKVRNPHLIFPGDIIYIHTSPAKKQVTENGSIQVEKLVPTIRIIRKGAGKPISTLRHFMAWPMIVSDEGLSQSPYIVSGRGATLLMEQGRKVYIKGLKQGQSGDSYAVYHSGDTLIDPDTQKLIGHEVNYHGKIRISRFDEISIATIEKSNHAIRAGDRVIKVDNKKPDLSMPMTLPTQKVRGSVVSLHEASMISGQQMVISINIGHKEGIQKGHVLGVYTPPSKTSDPFETRKTRWNTEEKVQVDLPPEKIASIIIYKVGDGISYGLINHSEHEVKPGYKIGNP
ncbi:MAG: LysM peptidoglycan-binding domain-containing protein [Thiotrichaceae bacterium]|nr:LysM peptidoglycan-binding domain-containing protein [Thiotrichaceae bacterium]